MTNLYLTPASISYLAEFILSLAIVLYFADRWRKPENFTLQKVAQVVFLVFITAFIGLLFLGTALLFNARLVVIYLLNISIAVALIFLLQFAYRHPELNPRFKNEAWVVLIASIAYAVFEFVFTVYRFSLLAGGQVIQRIRELEYIFVLGFLLTVMVLLRQTIYASKNPRSPADMLRALWQPQTRSAKNVRVVSLVYIFLFLLSVSSMLLTRYQVSQFSHQLIISLGILLTLFGAFAIYLNFQPHETSFRLKIVGTSLMISLAMFGAAGWVIAPAYTSVYSPALPGKRSLLFTPNANGGYDLDALPFHFETNWGERLDIQNSSDGSNSAALDFKFSFYDKTYSRIFVGDNGIIGMGEPPQYQNMQSNYGTTPALLPLYLDLDPEAGGVYARQSSDRLLLTWDAPGFYHPEFKFTFQALLYSDGTFEISYNDLPANIRFYADENPESSAWLVGAVRGDPSFTPEVFDSNLYTWEESGSEGFVQDYYLAFRKYQHQIFLPFLYLILVNSLLVLFGLPLMIQNNVVKPLQDLLAGISQVQVGDLNVELPVQHRDEFGVLAGSFNTVVSRLRAYLTKLEERVTERTQELQATNDLLRSEISKYEEAKERLTEQQRKIVVAEEREQMARDLQDSFGQVIGYVNVQAQAVRTLLNKNEVGAAQENLQLLVQAAQGAHADLRNYILGLRDPEKQSHSFFESLRTYLNAFSQAWEIETVFSPPQDTLPILAETVEDQLLQIVQEALVNIRKHAEAKRVEVLMTFLPRELILIISDNGRGFDPQNAPGVEQKHFGLSIMRERAEQVGGRVEVRSVVGQGTQVVAHIPRIFSSAQKRAPEELLGLRILLVDDQPLFLEGMRNLLTSRGLTVIGQARDGFDAFEQVQALRPDIVLMDVQMPRCNGIEATRLIKAEFPETKVVLLTVAEDGDDLLGAVKLGVSGYFLKSMDVNEIFFRLVAVIHGEMAIPPTLVSHLLTELPHAKEPSTEEELTLRQWEILQLVAKGLTYKEVARLLNISEVTIKYHMGQILERLHLKNREQAVAYALRMMTK